MVEGLVPRNVTELLLEQAVDPVVGDVSAAAEDVEPQQAGRRPIRSLGRVPGVEQSQSRRRRRRQGRRYPGQSWRTGAAGDRGLSLRGGVT